MSTKNLLAAVACLCLLTAPITRAQSPTAIRLASGGRQPNEVEPRPYDGIQAGLDAYKLAEERRQIGVADQLHLNDQLRFQNGYPTSRGATIYYGYLSPATAQAYGYSYRPPFAGLDYTYAFSPTWTAPAWPHGPYVFEPWPYIPGDIYGYGATYPPARQPLGLHQIQTGPRRWESHPIYNPPPTHSAPMPSIDPPPSEAAPPPPPRPRREY